MRIVSELLFLLKAKDDKRPCELPRMDTKPVAVGPSPRFAREMTPADDHVSTSRTS
jgi:hypothetical protein